MLTFQEVGTTTIFLRLDIDRRDSVARAEDGSENFILDRMINKVERLIRL